MLFRYSTEVTGAQWPLARAAVSPCPTLKVIHFVTSILDKAEEKKTGKLSRTSPKSMADVMQGLSLA
jgi:hypothetical protein